MAINPDYQFEKLLLKSQEKKEPKEKNFDKENAQEKKKDVDTAAKKEQEARGKQLKIKPQDAHRIALRLLADKRFARMLRMSIAEKIVHGENITRLDVVMEKGNAEQLHRVYGITKEHFRDLENGNITWFTVGPDGDDVAIFFKRATGEPAIRPMDNAKLAKMVMRILNAYPDLAPPDFQSDIGSK